MSLWSDVPMNSDFIIYNLVPQIESVLPYPFNHVYGNCVGTLGPKYIYHSL